MDARDDLLRRELEARLGPLPRASNRSRRDIPGPGGLFLQETAADPRDVLLTASEADDGATYRRALAQALANDGTVRVIGEPQRRREDLPSPARMGGWFGG